MGLETEAKKTVLSLILYGNVIKFLCCFLKSSKSNYRSQIKFSPFMQLFIGNLMQLVDV